MGAEREDTDPKPNRVGTEPGLGKASGPKAAVAEAVTEVVEEEPPPPVDFDALHAALGDPLDYQDMGSGPALEKLDEVDELFEGNDELPPDVTPTPPPVPIPPPTPQPRGKNVRSGESSGRSSATYASARPHTIPPTRSPTEDLNAPAVIVATEDTVPSAPPQMTVPLNATPYAAPMGAPPMGSAGIGTPMPGPAYAQGAPPVPQARGQVPGGPPPPPGHPSSGSQSNAAPAHTPQPFPAIQRSAVPQMTMRMPDRPVNMRRGKTPTIVVRARGPSAKQKLIAFMAALMLVTAVGIAVIIWRKPKLLGLEPPASPSASTSASSGSLGTPAPSPSSAASSAASSSSSAPSPSASSASSAAPTATTPAKIKAVKPAPPPTGAAPAPAPSAAPAAPHPSAQPASGKF